MKTSFYSRRYSKFWVVILVSLLNGCASLPEPKHDTFHFPKGKAYIEIPKRPYTVVGQVRSKVDYSAIEFQNWDNLRSGVSKLCVNYYNKAAKDLVKLAEDKGADAVIKVRSIVFLEDGRREEFSTPECAEDGQEGQILLQGLAVKWVTKPKEKGEDA